MMNILSKNYKRYKKYQKDASEKIIDFKEKLKINLLSVSLALFFLFIPLAIFFTVGIFMLLDRNLFFLFYTILLIFLFMYLYNYFREKSYQVLRNTDLKELKFFCFVESFIEMLVLTVLLLIYYISGVNIL